MRKETANWDLEHLLNTRAYQELTPIQQEWVLDQMPRVEYDRQRWTLLAAKEYLATDPVPAAPPLESILQKARIRPANQGFFSYIENITSWQVPAWQLAMAITCGWIFGQWNVGQGNSNLSLVPQMVYHTDTIVREIPIYIGIGKQRYAAYQDSQNTKVVSATHSPRRRNAQGNYLDSTSASIAHERELLELAVGMQ